MIHRSNDSIRLGTTGRCQTLTLMIVVLIISGCALPTGSKSASEATRPDLAGPLDRGQLDPAVAAMTGVPSEVAAMAMPLPPELAHVAHFTPAQLAGSCPCGNHGTAAGSDASHCPTGSCPPAGPFGYVMQHPQAGWNAYGIDHQEFLCDGGDKGAKAKVLRNDSIAGLGLEDTVVNYTTNDGQVHVQPSNQACVYAPRFLAVRKITNGAIAGGRSVALSGIERPQGPAGFQHDLPGLVMSDAIELERAEVARRTDAMRERNRGVPVENVLQLEQTGFVMAALAALREENLGEAREAQLALLEKLALAAVPWTVDESLEVAISDLSAPTLTRDLGVEAFTIYDFPDAGRLRIAKLADRSDALPGETVQFVIQVENVGDSAVENVMISDNLTTRLEYIDGSQQVEGGQAEFDAVANEGLSFKLSWKLAQPLEVGESVTIQFQCKVR